MPEWADLGCTWLYLRRHTDTKRGLPDMPPRRWRRIIESPKSKAQPSMFRPLFIQLSLLAFSACAVGQTWPVPPESSGASVMLIAPPKDEVRLLEKKWEAPTPYRLPFGAGFENRQAGQKAGGQGPASGKGGGKGR